MTCNLNIVKSFRVSRTLFTNEDGSPTLFYMASPSDDLKEIIDKGGGLLVEDSTQECIKLCENRNDRQIKMDFLPLSYIKHCVMKNELLDVQHYREKFLNQDPPSEKNVNDSDGSDSDSSSTKQNVIFCPQIMGRKKYTVAEDLNIIKFIIDHHAYSKIRGNRLWMQMESLKITDHTYQSMKHRYLKSILPNIHQYDISPQCISKFTKSEYKWPSIEDFIGGSRRRERDEEVDTNVVQMVDDDTDGDTSTAECDGQSGGGSTTASGESTVWKRKLASLDVPEPSGLRVSKRKGKATSFPGETMVRRKYTTDEDMNIIKYIIKHDAYQEVKGNRVWMEMGAKAITDHTYQSMKYRYLNSILPNIQQYDIPIHWIAKLTDDEHGWTSDEEEEDENENLARNLDDNTSSKKGRKIDKNPSGKRTSPRIDYLETSEPSGSGMSARRKGKSRTRLGDKDKLLSATTFITSGTSSKNGNPLEIVPESDSSSAELSDTESESYAYRMCLNKLRRSVVSGREEDRISEELEREIDMPIRSNAVSRREEDMISEELEREMDRPIRSNAVSRMEEDGITEELEREMDRPIRRNAVSRREEDRISEELENDFVSKAVTQQRIQVR